MTPQPQPLHTWLAVRSVRNEPVTTASKQRWQRLSQAKGGCRGESSSKCTGSARREMEPCSGACRQHQPTLNLRRRWPAGRHKGDFRYLR
eukprot:6191340-Pleurochrysis_carterae.AAC.5